MNNHIVTRTRLDETHALSIAKWEYGTSFYASIAILATASGRFNVLHDTVVDICQDTPELRDAVIARYTPKVLESY